MSQNQGTSCDLEIIRPCLCFAKDSVCVLRESTSICDHHVIVLRVVALLMESLFLSIDFHEPQGFAPKMLKLLQPREKGRKKTNIRNEQTKISDADSHGTDIFTGLLICVKQSPFTGFFNFKNNRCGRFGIQR